MPEVEAREWLRKCVDSGLWIPNAQDAEGTDDKPTDEETYEEVKEPSS